MNDLATIDAYGEVIEPATLKIQRLMPGPIERVWTYLTEKYGTAPVSDSVEGGMNLMVEFWKESAANTNRDGIANRKGILRNQKKTTDDIRDTRL